MPSSSHLEKLQIQKYVDLNDFALDNSGSTLTSTLFKAAILELAARQADALVVTPQGNLTSTDAQSALVELQAEIDNLNNEVAGGLNFKGGYDAASNIPDLDTASAGVEIGDVYTATSAGNFFTAKLDPGNVLIAKVDAPAALDDWAIVQRNIDETASQIGYDPGGNELTATDLQGAVDEAQGKIEAIESLFPDTPQPQLVNEATLSTDLTLTPGDRSLQHLFCETPDLTVSFNAPVNGTHFLIKNDITSTESFTVEGISIDPGEVYDAVYGDTKWMII